MYQKLFFTAILALLCLPLFSSPVSAPSGGDDDCQIQLSGSYNITPIKGSDAIVITTDNKKSLDIRFILSCCDDKNLDITIEDPMGQSLKAELVEKGIFGFTAKLSATENNFVLSAKCKKNKVAEQKIIVRVQEIPIDRLDYAVIFAESKHYKKAAKQGWVDLKYSLEDALALQYVLEKKYGFKVRLYTDPTWEEMNTAIQDLIDRDWGTHDQLLIYYTGHGHKGPDGGGYLVPSNVDESIKTYYKMEDMRNQVDQITCNNIVVGIDACFASSFLERGGKDLAVRSEGVPFKYFIGSSPSNREIPEKGIVIKDPKAHTDSYKFGGRKFQVSDFMMVLLESLEMGEKEYRGSSVPVWYVGRKVEEMYRPKNPGKGENIYARATRYGSQNDQGFHFTTKK
ncbi:MAG: caspase family protein [Bacteroidia bacterium]